MFSMFEAPKFKVMNTFLIVYSFFFITENIIRFWCEERWDRRNRIWWHMFFGCYRWRTPHSKSVRYKFLLYQIYMKLVLQNQPIAWGEDGLKLIEFNAAFNNIPVISWWSVLFVEETGVNHRPVASHWQSLSYNVVSSTPCHEWGSNSQICCDRHWLYR
jgi:hypothetical protein